MAKRQCAWPGCTERPVERGDAGMCEAHAGARHADALATAYLDMADELDDLAHDAWSRHVPEGVRPLPPGPRELERLARECRTLARYHLTQLPDRPHRREIPVAEPRAAIDPYVEEGLLGLWAGRPFAARQRVSPEEWQQLRGALGALEPEERRAVVLVWGQGMAHREAGGVLGVSKGHLHRLLESARHKLGRSMPI